MQTSETAPSVSKHYLIAFLVLVIPVYWVVYQTTYSGSEEACLRYEAYLHKTLDKGASFDSDAEVFAEHLGLSEYQAKEIKERVLLDRSVSRTK